MRPLVVASHQQDQLSAVRVTEDAEQDSAAVGDSDGSDVTKVAAKPELEESSAKLLSELRTADADTEMLKHFIHRVAERSPLRRGELLPKPAPHGLVAVRVLVELDFPGRHRVEETMRV
jgi:hypothetical protein